MDSVKNKYYNPISINCYWQQFDINGDGIPDKAKNIESAKTTK